MSFVLRFVQRFRPADRDAFMELEAQFAAMEERRADWLKGTRRQPYSGREPANTLIWEAQFSTLAEVQEALARVASDAEHEALFRKQVPFMTDTFTEIDEVLEF
jgi:hypothetical protein